MDQGAAERRSEFAIVWRHDVSRARTTLLGTAPRLHGAGPAVRRYARLAARQPSASGPAALPPTPPPPRGGGAAAFAPPLPSAPPLTRLRVASFLGPEDLLLLGCCGKEWAVLAHSEYVWATLATELGALSLSDSRALRHQRAAVRLARETMALADGRAWADGCLFAAAYADLVRSLPADKAAFALVDMGGAPGVGTVSPARARSGPSERAKHPGGGGGGDEDGASRRVVLVFFDPRGLPLERRVPQIKHLKALEGARERFLPQVTHVLHCRDKGDLDLARLTAWLNRSEGIAMEDVVGSLGEVAIAGGASYK